MVPERLCNGRVSVSLDKVRLSRRSIACSSDVQLVCCSVRAQAAAGLVSIDSCRRPSCICGQSFREPRYDNAVQHSRVKLGIASKTSVGPAPRCCKLFKTVQDNLSECRPVLLAQLRHRIYQWCIAKSGGGYTQRGVEKGLKVPCLFTITEVSIRCQKNRRLVYGVYPPIHHWLLILISCVDDSFKSSSTSSVITQFTQYRSVPRCVSFFHSYNFI